MPESVVSKYEPASEPKDHYWSDQDILNGKPILTDTMRVARFHRVDSEGRRIFITPSGQLLCPHGERPSTILSWTGPEECAKRDGLPVPARKNTTCTCDHTELMYHTKSNPLPPAEELPPVPSSLYTFLEALDTHKIVVRGQAARHVPGTGTGTGAMYVRKKGGHFCCKHLHTLAVIKKMKKARELTQHTPSKFRGGMCGCTLPKLPQRVGRMDLSPSSSPVVECA